MGVMTTPYRISVSKFIGHFQAQLDQIAQVPSEHFQKILYSLILDPLAQAAYPAASSRKNVVFLIQNLTSWADADRVSLIQLKLALRSKQLTKYRLYREVKKRLEIQSIGFQTPLSTSPHKSELLTFAASKEENKLLDLCTYANLFYTYRCNLVHEFREPGYGVDWERSSSEPYYGQSSFGERELVFPLRFVSRIANEALENLEVYLLANRIAPRSKFKYGSFWQGK
jgi:hypothetical protein